MKRISDIIYNIFTGILAQHMFTTQHIKKHVVQNYLWDKSQIGKCEKVLGTVDQLLI